MRKRVFYPKLALSNLFRNRKTYAPYLLACVVSIFTFYTLMSINMNGALNELRNAMIVKSFTAIGTIVVSIFCGALIFYTNSFLIKRRKKELGLYSILGMEKGNIALLMLFETLFITAAALIIGVLLGMLLSQLLFWLLLKMLRFDIMLKNPVSFISILFTCALFGVIFFVTFLTNLRQVHIANPVNLLSGSKQGEKEPKSSLIMAVAGVICLAGGYICALYFYSPMEILMFFFLAVFLVILGTFLLFTSGSITLLKAMRKNKNYYYKPNHFILVSGMIYRMKQNAAGLATICVLSCMVLITVSSTVSLNVGSEDSLNIQYPYDYEIVYAAPNNSEEFSDAVATMAEETGVSFTAFMDYSYTQILAKGEENEFVESNEFNSINGMNYFTFISLADYNKNENANERLEANEALVLTVGGKYEYGDITVNGNAYKLRGIEKFGKSISGQKEIARRFTVVVPGEITGEEVWRNLSFDIDGTDEAKAQFYERLPEVYQEFTAQEDFNLRTASTKEDNRSSWYATNGGFLFLGVYFGILFMLAAVLIIYYKQLSEGYDDAERFEILQKVGMSEAEVKQTINRQILTVFFMPLIVAVIHIAVAFFPVSRVMIIFSAVNVPLMAAATAITVIVYAAVYLLVFKQTAKTYLGIVRR